jgi:hypothetical protein
MSRADSTCRVAYKVGQPAPPKATPALPFLAAFMRFATPAAHHQPAARSFRNRVPVTQVVASRRSLQLSYKRSNS